MNEMIMGTAFVAHLNHDIDYATFLQRIMTYLVSHSASFHNMLSFIRGNLCINVR